MQKEEELPTVKLSNFSDKKLKKLRKMMKAAGIKEVKLERMD